MTGANWHCDTKGGLGSGTCVVRMLNERGWQPVFCGTIQGVDGGIPYFTKVENIYLLNISLSQYCSISVLVVSRSQLSLSNS